LSVDTAVETIFKQRLIRTGSGNSQHGGSLKKRRAPDLLHANIAGVPLARADDPLLQQYTHPYQRSDSVAGVFAAMSSAPTPKNSETSPGKIGAGQSSSVAQTPTGAGPSGSVSSPQQGNPFFFPKSNFKMAHESFRLRMFQASLQEQYGFEPVWSASGLGEIFWSPGTIFPNNKPMHCKLTLNNTYSAYLRCS